MGALATWAAAAMIALVPHGVRRELPGWAETKEQMEARYLAIGEAIEAVALATDTGFSDKREVALLVALAKEESDFAPDADVGPCYRGARGGAWWSRCDGGTSYSAWQVKAYRKSDGTLVTGADLQGDRKAAARRALWLAVGSMNACKKLDERDRLSAYVRGTCQAGHAGSSKRIDLWRKVEAWKPKP